MVEIVRKNYGNTYIIYANSNIHLSINRHVVDGFAAMLLILKNDKYDEFVFNLFSLFYYVNK